MLRPNTLAPPLEFPLADGRTWRLRDKRRGALTLISFFRGGFCKYCRAHLAELDAACPDFAGLGVDVVAVSVDDAASASRTMAQQPLTRLDLGYGLRLEDVRAFELFASRREVEGRSIVFAEPALVFIRPSGLVYAVWQNSMSCGRPDLASLCDGLQALAAQGFPTRGDT